MPEVPSPSPRTRLAGNPAPPNATTSANHVSHSATAVTLNHVRAGQQRFGVEEEAKVYLERELGLEKASQFYGRDAKVWRWQMRCSTPGA